MSARPPLVLASTSPQRRAILEKLRIPFEVVSPPYQETARDGGDPIRLVREHARGKAVAVARRLPSLHPERPVLGVDTAVVLDGRVHGKPATAQEAVLMLEALAGRTHEVVSGLSLVTADWELVEHQTTRVTFRALVARELTAYVASGEWEGRAGGYAIQGLGATLVERVEGDYENVVGLPVALLVRLLAERFPGTYGFG